MAADHQAATTPIGVNVDRYHRLERALDRVPFSDQLRFRLILQETIDEIASTSAGTLSELEAKLSLVQGLVNDPETANSQGLKTLLASAQFDVERLIEDHQRHQSALWFVTLHGASKRLQLATEQVDATDLINCQALSADLTSARLDLEQLVRGQKEELWALCA